MHLGNYCFLPIIDVTPLHTLSPQYQYQAKYLGIPD